MSAPRLRARVLDAVRELGYAPSQVARNLRRGRSELIAIVVADLANPFYARVVCAAEAAVAGLGLLARRLQQRREAGRREAHPRPHPDASLRGPHPRARSATRFLPRRGRREGRRTPTVLFGRTVDDNRFDAVTIDNFAAAQQATNYLIDLGHRRIGAITGPLHVSTGRAPDGGHAGRARRQGA